MEAKQTLYIKDLRPGMKNLHMTIIVLEIGSASKTKEGHTVWTLKVADKTACISFSVWDALGQAMQAGDIIKLQKGYCGMFRGCTTLYCGIAGRLQKTGEFCMLFSETPNMSEPNSQEVISQIKQQNFPGNSANIPPHHQGQSDGRTQLTGQPHNGARHNFAAQNQYTQPPPPLPGQDFQGAGGFPTPNWNIAGGKHNGRGRGRGAVAGRGGSGPQIDPRMKAKRGR